MILTMFPYVTHGPYIYVCFECWQLFMIQVPLVTRQVAWLSPMERPVPFSEEVRMIIFIILIVKMIWSSSWFWFWWLWWFWWYIWFFAAVYKYRCNSGLEMDGPDTVILFLMLFKKDPTWWFYFLREILFFLTLLGPAFFGSLKPRGGGALWSNLALFGNS